MATATTAADLGGGTPPRRRERGLALRGILLLVEYWRMHPLVFSLSILGALGYATCTLGSTVVLGRVTDRILGPAFGGGIDASKVALGVTAIMAVAVVRAGTIGARRSLAGLTHARVARDLRLRVTRQYGALPVAFHRTVPTGDLLAHVQADVEAATECIGPTPYSIAVIAMIAGAAVMLVLTDPILALVGGTVLPGLAILNAIFTRRIAGRVERMQRALGDVSAVAHESIDGALVVKTLGREEDEVARFALRADTVRRERTEMGRIRAGYEPALDVLPDLGAVILVGLGALRVSQGAISTGTLIQFVTLFQFLAFPVRTIGFLLSELPRAVVGRDRVAAIEAEPIRGVARSGDLMLPPGPLGVEVDGVCMSYPGGEPVLRGLTLAVPPNTATAIVGATGAGKSSLVSLLARLSDPEDGAVRVGGVDLRNLRKDAVQLGVAVVFQEAFLFGSTVRDNITLGADIDPDEVVRAAGLAQADGFIHRLPRGYDTAVGERGITLSGGQRQRIALARALVRRPRVLILDDATSAVDPTVEAAILEALRVELQTTLIVVAYRVSTIALADSVVLLEDGCAAAQGSHDELLRTSPAYAAMVHAYERDRR